MAQPTHLLQCLLRPTIRCFRLLFSTRQPRAASPSMGFAYYMRIRNANMIFNTASSSAQKPKTLSDLKCHFEDQPTARSNLKALTIVDSTFRVERSIKAEWDFQERAPRKTMFRLDKYG